MPDPHAAYVGMSAFAHKGGIHVAAVEKIPASYEHVPPESIGNQRQIVVSELSGRGNVRVRAQELGLQVKGVEAAVLAKVKELEAKGFQFEAAEGSFELSSSAGTRPGYRPPFEILDVLVISEQRRSREMIAEAAVKVRVGDQVQHTVAEGTAVPRARARPRAPQGAAAVLPGARRRVRLTDYKGPHPGSGREHARHDAGAHQGDGLRRGSLGHRGLLGEHHRGQLHGAGRQPGAVPARTSRTQRSGRTADA